MHQHLENTGMHLNQLVKVIQTADEHEIYWFPTRKQLGDPDTYTPIQQ